LRAIASKLGDDLDKLDEDDIVRSIYSLGKFHFRDDRGRCLGLLSGQARRHIWNYSVDDCAQMIASLSRAQAKNPGFVSRVVDRVFADSMKGASYESLVNLMTGLARFGVKDSKKKQIWSILADEVSTRLEQGHESSNSDILNALTAYSYPNVNRAHERLFKEASKRLRSRDSFLTPQETMKYLRACARVEFRDIESLVYVGTCLRRMNVVKSLSKEDLLVIYTALNKLGAEMAELTEELKARGMEVPGVKGVTWFRSGTSVHNSRNS
jgi:hypothetical protein